MTGTRRAATLAVAVGFLAGPLLAVAGITPASEVSAWNGSTTAAYADAHWNDCKTDGSVTFTSDGYLCFGNPPGATNCNAFASEALHAGGYSYVNISSTDKWYWNLGNENARRITNPNWSRSFGDSRDLYNFLVIYDHDNHNGTGAGGGWLYRTDVGYGAATQNDTLSYGDMLFFSFYGGNNTSAIDHTRVEISWYSSGSTLPHAQGYYAPWNAWIHYGDYADNQSPGRYHDFWNGAYADAATGLNPQQVVIWEVHVDSANI